MAEGVRNSISRSSSVGTLFSHCSGGEESVLSGRFSARSNTPTHSAAACDSPLLMSADDLCDSSGEGRLPKSNSASSMQRALSAKTLSPTAGGGATTVPLVRDPAADTVYLISFKRTKAWFVPAERLYTGGRPLQQGDCVKVSRAYYRV